MQKCILCNKETTGSVGAAGFKWYNLCQECKDQADQEALASFKAQASIINQIFGDKK